MSRTLPREALDEYTRRLNAVSESARSYIVSELSAFEFETEAELRAFVMALVDEVGVASVELSAGIAADFYEKARVYQTGEERDADDAATVDIAPTRYAAASLSREMTGSVEELVRFANSLADSVDVAVKRQAGETITTNARRDPKKPRFARVPTGAETCRFCIMLASRGFVYANAATAGEFDHYHPKCDCRIVPGFGDEPKVEGYDVEELFDVYKHPERHQEFTDALNARRRELYADRVNGPVRPYTRRDAQ